VCGAQNDSVPGIQERHINIKLSSNSSLIYPGISTGIEFPVCLFKHQEWIVKSESRTFLKKRYISGNISWYHHPEFHDNIYFTVEYIMRRTRCRGFTSEFSAGSGYSKTYLAGTTYSVDDLGKISIIKYAGYSYALITFGGGVGYDLWMVKKIPLAFFSKMNMLLMFPYNSTIYFRPVLELGIRLSTGHMKTKGGKE
jgi:hypothetical protein